MSNLPKPPKDAIKRINLGQSFAENDLVLRMREVFVTTPAVLAAQDPARGHCFFVGRRGSGKTAIAIHLLRDANKNAVSITPYQFVPSNMRLPLDRFLDTRQKPFKSLANAFKIAITLEVVSHWVRSRLTTFNQLPDSLGKYRNLVEQHSFDSRLLTLVDERLVLLEHGQDTEWLRAMKQYDNLRSAMNSLEAGRTWATTLLIDRLDDAWSGDDASVAVLMAMMHSSVQLHSECSLIRPLLFLRENIFDRVRAMDNEFSRLETSVVSMDWSPAQLLELIERRLNASFTTKWPLRGSTWAMFFEATAAGPSYEYVFDYCQHRPRDVITYLSFAISAALASGHTVVTLNDLQAAKRRFSENRFKDLCDEYSENYSQITLVLERFYGLGSEFTLTAIDQFIQLLITDPQVQAHCSSWLNHVTAPERFVEWLYGLGFVGLRKGPDLSFKALGARSGSGVRLDQDTHIVIHPTFADALQLQDKVVTSLSSTALRKSGILEELPEGVDLDTFTNQCQESREELKTLPRGHLGKEVFEELVGKVLRLCFYRVLTNPEPKVRHKAGVVIRDWMVSNRATQGFWEVVRQKYGAVQVIWECKNYDDLNADDFHQVNYYHTDIVGKFSVIAFRGEFKKSYFEHQKRIADNGGFALLVSERDLEIFLRQTQNGKWQETHIQNLYDEQIRRLG
ncbi:MAG: ATP-binding protein [Phycisphaeraceae bacterium]|nr:ATP-binding protein [Phycisphaeraceae bacterium]